MANMTSGGSRQQLRILVEQHAAVEALCAIAAATADVKVVVVALEAVENLLAVYEELKHEQDLVVNTLVTRLRATVAFDQLESLIHHANPDVYHAIITIRENYFDVVDEVKS